LCAPLLLTLLATACGPSPRPIPPLPAPPMKGSYALGSDSLETAWDQEVGRGLFASPNVIGPAVFVTTTNRAVVALNRETGRKYWERRFNNAITSGVTVSGNRLFFASEDLKGKAYAIDATRGRQVWEQRIGPVRHALAVEDNAVYVGTLDGYVLSLNAQTGRVLWKTRLGRPTSFAPILHGDALLIATSADTLYRIATGNGQVLARAALGGTASADPLVLNNRLYVPLHDSEVITYDALTLSEQARTPTASPVLSSPQAIGTEVFVLTQASELYRLGDGPAQQVASFNGASRGSLTAAGDRLLVGLLDGRLLVVDREGKIRGQVHLGGSIAAPATVADDGIYVGLLRGTMIKLEQH